MPAFAPLYGVLVATAAEALTSGTLVFGSVRPVAMIVHGGHSMEVSSEPGYDYLGEHLASHGYVLVSVDQNFLNHPALLKPIELWTNLLVLKPGYCAELRGRCRFPVRSQRAYDDLSLRRQFLKACFIKWSNPIQQGFQVLVSLLREAFAEYLKKNHRRSGIPARESVKRDEPRPF